VKNSSSSPRQLLLELVSICGLVAIDLIVKALTSRPYPNYYFAFSLPLPPRVSISIALVLIAIAAVWLYATPREHLFRRASLVLVIAGGTANILERAWRGYVTDIIQISQASLNLADTYILIGISVLLLSVFITVPTESPRHSTPPD